MRPPTCTKRIVISTDTASSHQRACKCKRVIGANFQGLHRRSQGCNTMLTCLPSAISRFSRVSCSPRVSAVRLHVASVLPTALRPGQYQDSRMLQWPDMMCPALRQPAQHQLCCKAASSSSNSGDYSNSSSSQPLRSQSSVLNWFDRLPPKVQLTAMGVLLFVGMLIIPFLQPSFLYGNKSKQAGGTQPATTQVHKPEPSYTEKYKLPRYIPGASELYDFLQENSMPRQTPDGRSESPGVIRIYTSSMIILAVFYLCSAVVSLILKGVTGILRAVGVMGPAPPRPKEG